MQIYHYHHITHEYLGSAEADPDPRAPGNYLYPAFSTTVAPPDAGENQAAVFNNGAWSLVPDHRAETWYREDRSSVMVTALGDPAAEGLLAECPAPTSQELANYAADVRYRKEIAGIPWTPYYVIQTDRESQVKMLAEFIAIGAGLRTDPSPWKFADNRFAVLSNTEMSNVCLAGRTHVATVFAVEQAVQAQIIAGIITTFAEIDDAFEAPH